MDASEKGVSPEAGETPAGFEINGVKYPIPSLDSLTLDEERILYVYADTVIKDFISPHPKASDEEKAEYLVYQARKIRNPDLKRALAYIAYKRKHPEEEEAGILTAIGRINAFELDLAMFEGDDSPPAPSSQNGQQKQTESNEPTSNTGSGSDSSLSSAEVVDLPVRTGTPVSDTSSPGAPPTGLAS